MPSTVGGTLGNVCNILYNSREDQGGKSRITHLTSVGKTVSGKRDILRVTHTFNSNLYGPEAVDEESCQRLVSKVHARLSDVDQNKCEGYIELQECTAALKQMKANKAPGLDGLPTEFYRAFYSIRRLFDQSNRSTWKLLAANELRVASGQYNMGLAVFAACDWHPDFCNVAKLSPFLRQLVCLWQCYSGGPAAKPPTSLVRRALNLYGEIH